MELKKSDIEAKKIYNKKLMEDLNNIEKILQYQG